MSKVDQFKIIFEFLKKLKTSQYDKKDILEELIGWIYNAVWLKRYEYKSENYEDFAQMFEWLTGKYVQDAEKELEKKVIDPAKIDQLSSDLRSIQYPHVARTHLTAKDFYPYLLFHVSSEKFNLRNFLFSPGMLANMLKMLGTGDDYSLKFIKDLNRTKKFFELKSDDPKISNYPWANTKVKIGITQLRKHLKGTIGSF